MSMYAITATVETRGKGDYSGSRQVPTFYLDERVQGITNEASAERIARDILASVVPSGIAVVFHVTAVAV